MRRDHNLVPRWVRSVLCLTAAGSVPLLVIAAVWGCSMSYELVGGICLFAGHTVSIAFGRPGMAPDVLRRLLRPPHGIQEP